MKALLQHVGSRVIEVTLGSVLGVLGLLFCGMGIEIGVTPVGGTQTRAGVLLVAGTMLAIGIPAVVFAGRLVFPRLRGWHGGIIGPLGFEITGVILLISPHVTIFTRRWGDLPMQLVHVGTATTCFALARARRRAAREPYTMGPEPIRPE